ncbi:glutathione S-transferase family protein [Engelhardtia mirabilis]|uniref:Maleylpyruvate isomerase n=1 Tax=Engelhardtia mirabilis TaxID=2528011 RepID=A0A518BSA7_9BACT|nr:Maleylpyruvate isomerase [Planctomycetes bacterium Pla133]QDV04171.1 Maleylpyruvate isomerase [Planctomycetes bacterium Pla86]
MKLILGSKNYSSWSLRAWMAAVLSGLPFEEVMVHFDEDADRKQRLRHSPTGKVPALADGNLTVSDSLAIGEYLAELAPERGLWPKDRSARAHARSICAEMHSGFLDLRQDMPMNIRIERPWRERAPGVMADIARIDRIWSETRSDFGAKLGGPFLFGTPTLADAYYAPVAARFHSFHPPLSPVAQAYVETLWAFEPMQRWCAAAREEGHALPNYDAKA